MEHPSDTLERYRRELQELDLQILLLLADRFRLTGEMGEMKKQLKMEVLQEAEWQKKISFLSANLEGNRFLEEILKVFRQIHDASVEIQQGGSAPTSISSA